MYLFLCAFPTAHSATGNISLSSTPAGLGSVIGLQGTTTIDEKRVSLSESLQRKFQRQQREQGFECVLLHATDIILTTVSPYAATVVKQQKKWSGVKLQFFC